MAEGFAQRVVDAVTRLGPLCAGVDPSAELLRAWGLSDDAAGLREFSARCVEAFAGAVPVVKPQVAFFERHGSAGMAVLESLIADARAAGLIVIADAKRGDIDTTAAAYADAWLGEASPFAPDAVTAHPYLGVGALDPLFEIAKKNDRGVIVVVRSSNPQGRALQEARTASGDAVEDALLREIAQRNSEVGGLGPIGAVIGATLAPSAFSLSQLKGIILAPGLGAQGATAEDVLGLFSGCQPGTVLPSSSRSLLSEGPEIGRLRSAALRACAEVATLRV
jgi:orotidine-5'-phosphate decarboxylase